MKEAEGVQFPMGLVLLTRLGEYERVTELSKYCVGCGRCAAKCPIGNSGPLVISAAYQACTEMKRKKALVEQEETGLMGRVTAYIIALIVVLAFVGLAADISTRSATCMVCHQQQADYAHWMTQELKAKNKGFSHELIACAACHIEGAAAGNNGFPISGITPCSDLCDPSDRSQGAAHSAVVQEGPHTERKLPVLPRRSRQPPDRVGEGSAEGPSTHRADNGSSQTPPHRRRYLRPLPRTVQRTKRKRPLTRRSTMRK